MRITKHNEFPIVSKRPVSRESAYTEIEHNGKILLRTTLDDFGTPLTTPNYEWCEMKIRKDVKKRFTYLDEDEELEIERLYQEELLRIQREDKLNRITNE